MDYGHLRRTAKPFVGPLGFGTADAQLGFRDEAASSGSRQLLRRATGQKAERVPVDDNMKGQLKALGYLY